MKRHLWCSIRHETMCPAFAGRMRKQYFKKALLVSAVRVLLISVKAQILRCGVSPALRLKE